MPLSASDCKIRATVGTGSRLSELILVSELGPVRATIRRMRTALSMT